MIGNGYQESARTAMTLAALTGDALFWARKRNLHSAIPFEQLKADLLAEFKALYVEPSGFVVYAELRNMKLTRKADLQPFLTKFVSLAKRQTHVKEDIAIYTLFTKLPAPMMECYRIRDGLSTFGEALNLIMSSVMMCSDQDWDALCVPEIEQSFQGLQFNKSGQQAGHRKNNQYHGK